MTIPLSHCCACVGVCNHVGGPWFCAAHSPFPGYPFLVDKTPYDDAVTHRKIEYLSSLLRENEVTCEFLRSPVPCERPGVRLVTLANGNLAWRCLSHGGTRDY